MRWHGECVFIAAVNIACNIIVINGEIAQLTFTVTNPIAYGRERTITVPSGGSVIFIVDGTAPTRPRIAASATRSASSQVWGLRLDEGDYLHVETGVSSACAVAIDCEERTLRINNNPAIPTLDSDWLELSPGEHTIRMDNGVGAATITYYERWY